MFLPCVGRDSNVFSIQVHYAWRGYEGRELILANVGLAIGTGIGIKGIIKGIKEESFSDSNSSFYEQAEGISIHDS